VKAGAEGVEWAVTVAAGLAEAVGTVVAGDGMAAGVSFMTEDGVGITGTITMDFSSGEAHSGGGRRMTTTITTSTDIGLRIIAITATHTRIDTITRHRLTRNTTVAIT
jgi:hypothetical protein